ncbi:MAG: nucleotidyl transferase AbiEii/AbiGii toxin family protein [Bacteroidales bacterium]|nr:nucleotidyl transferase AbiEii/AbiGii toxin family protein [Bacteroidales bacterium]
MLNLEQIKEYYPDSLKGFERFMLREYLQYKILEILFESKQANNFAFIGGTALRIIHGSERFSEDLDFDNFNLRDSEFDVVIAIIKTGLELLGYQVEIRSVKRGAYHCYIRFPNLLYDYGLSDHSGEKIFIRLDTEAQHFNFEPELVLINKFDVFTEIKTTPKGILLAQKIFAILNRERNKGRDFYDVVFLMGKNVQPNYDFLNQKLSIKNGAQLKNELLNKLKYLDMNEMASDVRPFLFNTSDVKKILLFEKYILQSEF